MKIAVLSCFYPYRGGIAQFNTCLADELAKGHTVKAFNFKRQYPDLLFPGKTQYVTPTDNIPQIRSERILDTVNPISYIRTVSAIRKWNPDILIVRYWMSFFAPSLGFITRRMRSSCKVISILDNVIPHERRFFDTPLTKYFLSGSDGCVTLCEAVEKDLLELKKDIRHTVINHPLYSQFGEKPSREDAMKSLGLDPDRKTLLFFGLIRDYKGLDILLEAFRTLPRDYQLVVAGEPYGSFGKYEEIIGGLPGKDRVHLFLNYISDDKVGTFFAAADVAVLPYRSATQSGISSVSYHFEVPVIVTGVGGLRETIGDRGTGLVAAECSPESIREEILRYFSDPQIREDCVRNIRLEKERLSWGTFCRTLLDFAGTLPDKQRTMI
ncbi:MAG: glycosyltransferase [Candidatus Cryptobacteroides sp.]